MPIDRPIALFLKSMARTAVSSDSDPPATYRFAAPASPIGSCCVNGRYSRRLTPGIARGRSFSETRQSAGWGAGRDIRPLDGGELVAVEPMQQPVTELDGGARTVPKPKSSNGQALGRRSRPGGPHESPGSG